MAQDRRWRICRVERREKDTRLRHTNEKKDWEKIVI